MEEKTTDIWIRRAKEGDMNAFRQLVDRHQHYAYSLTARFLKNPDDIRDVVQETFIRVWSHLHRFHEGKKFSTWLYRIVVNLCFDKLRGIKRQQDLLLPGTAQAFPGVHDPEPDQESIYIRKELAQSITFFASQLSDKQQAVFVLRDLQDLPMEEIAEILDMPLNGVKSNLYYARKNIREQIEKLNKEEYGYEL